jgi:la-related protein 1
MKGRETSVALPVDGPQGEPYTTFRERALRNRNKASDGETHYDMKALYEFWSHFLVRNFNPQMYHDFRTFAREDALQKQTDIGINCLITYYDHSLNNKSKTIPGDLARHYVDLVRNEDTTKERNGFNKLRAALRNGALNPKSRKKIEGFIDPDLKEALEPMLTQMS